MVKIVGGYEDSLKRLGVNSWQGRTAGAAPSYHFDMLHDEERNMAYRHGIEAVVEEEDLVIDIGTGSGILSILSVRAGAEHVFAIEGDPALERAATRVIEANGCAEKITIVGKHSSNVRVGFGADVPTGANVVVHEILDSFLLGEGVVTALHDVVERGLLAPGGKSVPAGATIHAMLVESPWLRAHQTLPDTALAGLVPQLRAGEAEARWTFPEPVQVNAAMGLALGLIRPLSAPFDAQLFDFARPVLSDAREIGVEMTAEGRVDAFLLWWTIHMDSSCAEDATVHLSTTPGQLIYAQPLPETPGTGGASPLGCLGAVRGLGDYQDVAASQDHQAHEVWPSFPPPEREHWRQAASIVTKADFHVTKGQKITVIAAHDAAHPRFLISIPANEETPPPLQPPSSSRGLLLQLADDRIDVAFRVATRNLATVLPTQEAVLLCVGDGPRAALALGEALFGREAAPGVDAYLSVLCLQSSLDACMLTQRAVEAAGFPSGRGGLTVLPVVARGETFEGTHSDALVQAAKGGLLELSGETRSTKFAGVVAQPSYWALAVAGAGGTWEIDQALRFASDLRALRASGLVGDETLILPRAVTVQATLVSCPELYRRRASCLSETNGVDLKAFNQVAPARRVVGSEQRFEEPTPADLLGWEGCLHRLSAPKECFRLDLAGNGCEPFSAMSRDEIVAVHSTGGGTCHAVILHTQTELEWGSSAGQNAEDPAGSQILRKGPRINGEGRGAVGFMQGLLLPSEPWLLDAGEEMNISARLIPVNDTAPKAGGGHSDARGTERLVLAVSPTS